MAAEANISSRKSNKSRRETAVQGTNDSSIVSKCSTAACGYYKDPFLHHFVSKISRRAPLIHRGYYIRAVAFDRIMKNFLTQHRGFKKQIISLGCGFDSSYFRLKTADLLENTDFYEIDFPDLVRRKRLLIENTEALNSLIEKVEGKPLSPHLELSCVGYHLLGIDLTQLNTLEAALKMCGLNFEHPTFLFSECVMTYMTRRCSTELVKWAAETFENAVFAMYEQINPDDAFGLFMQNHFHSIGSPLKCINSFPSLDAQVKRFHNTGWAWCEALDMNTFYYQCIPSEEQQRIESLEAFDEYEELNLKYSHYFILTASTSKQSTSLISEDVTVQYPSFSQPISDAFTLTLAPSEHQSVRRFGHSTALVNGRYAITTGGFGEIDGRHQRLAEITITDVDTLMSYHVLTSSPDVQYSRMHHVSASLRDGTVYLVGGRQSPYFMCSQILKLRLHISCDQPNISCGESQNFERAPQESEEREIHSRNGLQNMNSEESHVAESKHCSKSEENYSEKPHADSCATVADSAIDLSKDICDLKICDSNVSAEINSRLGGSVGDGGPGASNISSQFRQCWDFDLGQLEVDVVSQTGDLPQERWRHGLVTVDSHGKEKLFLYGGKTKSGGVLDDCFLFDPDSAEWHKLSCGGELPGPRHSHCLSFWCGQVVLTGGLDASHTPVGAVHVLDLTTMTWRTMDLQGSLYPRYSHTAHVSGDNMILVGGVNLHHPPPGVGVLCLKTRVAQEFSLPKQKKDSLLMFHRHSSLQTNPDQVIVFGGGGNCFSFGTHLNRTPVMLDISQCLSLKE
ncbi:tRNA wybutosine-synthesizing protein 4 [Aplysia californica]|uniref:tRNA wybutosine-synthesizing protein 4 n=1 Tax=Aplysia californica TaxID=6500 RepID=A0ABM0JXB1_APLCA|nr:tRNA wybutosine-synthesizing protein 4 [Aplysia californica]